MHEVLSRRYLIKYGTELYHSHNGGGDQGGGIVLLGHLGYRSTHSSAEPTVYGEPVYPEALEGNQSRGCRGIAHSSLWGRECSKKKQSQLDYSHYDC